MLTSFRNWITKLKLENLKKKEVAPEKPIAEFFVPVNLTPAQLTTLDLETEPLAGDLQMTLHIGIQCTFATHHSQRVILPWPEYLRILP